MIEIGKKKLSWFGTVEPVMIGGDASGSVTESATAALAEMASYLAGSTTAAASAAPAGSGPAASAEVSVSKDQAARNSSSRTTSLQF
jgi:hypothetical protein